MRLVLQRVSFACVQVNNEIVGEIGYGLLVFLGISPLDTEDDIDWLIKKLIALRIFNDIEGKMNFSVVDVKGQILVISQFTLFANCHKGNRPSFTGSASPTIAIPLYESFVERLKNNFSGKVATGIFGADMKVELLNDGPVTIILDSHNKDNT